ncbi:MAG: AAA family ATPase [Azospirillaceae bacterium]|nr:AAA family ATPase [Azospirillaceae bacterium]
MPDEIVLANQIEVALITTLKEISDHVVTRIRIPDIEHATDKDWLNVASGLVADKDPFPYREDIIGSALWLAAGDIPWARLMLVLYASQVAANKLSQVHRLARNLSCGQFDPVTVLKDYRALDTVRDAVTEDIRTELLKEQSQQLPETNSQTMWFRPVPFTADLGKYEALRRPMRLVGTTDLVSAQKTLVSEFPWLAEIIESIMMDLRLGQACGRPYIRIRPVLLHGASGIGKSRFARRLLEVLQIPVTTIMAAGVSDNRMMAGTAKGWSSATPSLPVKTMLADGVGNPGFIIEEIDKVGGSDQGGRLADTLLAMTDPEVSKRWFDECVSASVNLSKMNWIMTANRLDQVPAPLRARCMVLLVKGPQLTNFEAVLRTAQRDIADEFDIHHAMLPRLDEQAVELMRREFWRGELNARQLAGMVRRALTIAAGGGEHLVS